MSKILANEIANYGDDAPIDLKEGLNIPAGKPIQAAGIAGTSGQVLSSTGTSINWITPFDGDYTSLSNRPTIPAAQVNADWNASSGVAVILNKPTVPPITSLVVNSAGTPSLTFNGGNGQFTYTPPDLSNYDTAFGWGDHAQAGYVTTSGTQTISGAKTFSASTTFSDSVDFEGNPNAGAALSMQFYKGNGTNSDLDTLKFFNKSGITIGAGEGGGFTMRSWDSSSSYILSYGDNFFIDGGQSTAIKIRTQFARNAIVCNSDYNGGSGTVELYHSASGTATKKFETTSAGASVSGQLTVDGLVSNGIVNLISNNLITQGRLYYNNFFSGGHTTLPSANAYPGMFVSLIDGLDYGQAYFADDMGSTITVTVGVDTVAGQSTGVFYFDGVEKPGSYAVSRGSKYTFDQSNSTNATYGGVHHPLMFSTTLDGELAGGSHYMMGVTYKLDGVTKTMAEYVSGFTAATTRIVEWIPTPNSPNTLYYWCHFHTGQGNSFAIDNQSWIKLLDKNSPLGLLADVDLSTPPSTGQVLKWDGNNWVAGPDNAGSGGTGIALTDISVTTASAGTAALTYNNVSGVFTYTPPDVSSFLTSFTETDPVYSASPAAGILSSNISNWDTAYGWGNHASAGYLTTETSHADVVVDGDFTSAGLMSRGASSGTYSIVTDNSNNWNTAYGWGNHASAGYLTSYTVTASDLSGISVGALADVNMSGASVNDVLKWTGSAWTPQADATGGGGGANVTISDTAPGGASVGDLWWESDKGRLKIYYQDVDTTQWVDASPPLAPALSSNAPATASSAGSEGDIRFDSGYVYVCIATNTWKRAALTTW